MGTQTMIGTLPRAVLPSALCAGALLCLPAHGQGTSTGGDWRYAATVYLWGAGITGETASGAEVDVGFDTLIENLNMAFMGAFEARRSKWSVGADLIYLNVGANDGGTVPLRHASGATVDLDVAAGVETKGWVLNLQGGYNLLQSDRASVDVIVGARYLDLELDFNLGLAAGQYAVARDIAASQIVWDGILGVQGRLRLDRRWSLPFHFDVGTGNSDLTWQAAGGVAYGFDWGEVSLSYRHIAWDFGPDEALDHIDFNGPLLAATWRF
jgi:hypothetical protein